MSKNEGVDPRCFVAEAQMTPRQKVVIALCVLLNGLDGFDVLSVSYAAPGISNEWNIDRAELGIVLSMELVGMSIGSILLGQLADRIGQRAVALFCLSVMAIGMFLAALCPDPVSLGLVRLGTGVGIGGLIATISASAAGAANARSKTTAVALMAAGYPMGAVIGGTIASKLLVAGDWRDVFYLGAGLTAMLLPLAYALLPESLDSAMRRPEGKPRRDAVNRSLKMLGHAPMETIVSEVKSPAPRMGDLFSQSLRLFTILLIATYFFHMISFYFVLKWIPKIVADLGVPAAEAAKVLVWASLGGAIGSFLFSMLTTRLPLRSLILSMLAGSFVFISLFGMVPADIAALSWAGAAAGFCTNAAVVGLYALIAAVYPQQLRSGGTGMVIGLGRGGAAIGPVIGGSLFALGAGRAEVTMIMAAGSLVALFAIIRIYRSEPALAE